MIINRSFIKQIDVTERVVPLSLLQRGDILRVKPGAKIPADGEVVRVLLAARVLGVEEEGGRRAARDRVQVHRGRPPLLVEGGRDEAHLRGPAPERLAHRLATLDQQHARGIMV